MKWAALDGVPKALPRFLSEAVHGYNSILVTIQTIDVSKGMEQSVPDQLFQSAFGQAINIHGLLPNEVDELTQAPGLAQLIIAVQGLDDPILTIFLDRCFMDAGGLTAAGAAVRIDFLQCKTAAIHVAFHMRDDHVSFAD